MGTSPCVEFDVIDLDSGTLLDAYVGLRVALTESADVPGSYELVPPRLVQLNIAGFDDLDGHRLRVTGGARRPRRRARRAAVEASMPAVRQVAGDTRAVPPPVPRACGRPHRGPADLRAPGLRRRGLRCRAAVRARGAGDPAVAAGAGAAVRSPAFLWLGFFYLQDRHEPEPKHFVLGVFLLGGFVAAPVAADLPARPLPAWERRAHHRRDVILPRSLPLGLAQELAKYLVVRYSVYLSDEFDEPLDGIIYMTAAGIGFATAENSPIVAQVGAMFLGTCAVNAVVTTLAHG